MRKLKTTKTCPLALIAATLFWALTIFGSAATLHVIIVADTLVDDIGESVKADITHWKHALGDIKDYSGLEVKKTLLKDEDITVVKVRGAIDNLEAEPDDAVLFIYLGHGFNTAESTSIWPSLYLKDEKGGELGMKLTEIYETLSKKKPRLLLVLADCCNKIVPLDSVDMAEGRAFSPTLLKKAHYKSLFVDSKGSYLSSGCIRGQVSWCNPMKGGYYTVRVLEEMHKAVDVPDFDIKPTWDKIFTEVIKKPIKKTQIASETQIAQAQKAQDGTGKLQDIKSP